jgi:acyl-CoA synthetase (AMP-forming)/AMP-acid ligase II
MLLGAPLRGLTCADDAIPACKAAGSGESLSISMPMYPACRHEASSCAVVRARKRRPVRSVSLPAMASTPDEKWGERPKAFVELAEGEDASEEESSTSPRSI